MGRVAFVFPGQGAQYSGMGQALYEADSAARAVFDRLERLRPGTMQQCFHGEAEALAKTGVTQPCLYAVELAAAAALTAAGLTADCAAGFSLGELSALAYTGAVSLEDGFRLVCRRGDLMQQAAEAQPGGMAAVMKLTTAQVTALCKPYLNVWPVNDNCPGQIVVAGQADALTRFCADVAAAGGRAIRLRVQGGFHSPLMRTAADAFAAALAPCSLRAPSMPLYSNVTALPYEGEIKAQLSRQITSPVRWRETVEHMTAQGVDTFVELGAGRTLCGLISKTNPAAITMRVETTADLSAALERIQYAQS